MRFTAFILGLTAFGLVSADVSHLLKNQQAGHHQNSFGQQQVTKQAFTGNTQNNNRYWWMNTETLPFNQNSKIFTNNNLALASSSIECKRCSSKTVQLKRHNTPQNQNPYSHNPFMKGRYITRQPVSQQNHFHTQSARISGSPSDVNNYFGANNFQSSRIRQQQSCTDNSACVAPRFCLNGIIDQSYESQVPRSSPRRCNGQEVCCRFAQRRNANFKVFALDNEAAPAHSTSEVLTNEGYVVNKPSNQYLPVPQPSYEPAPANDDFVTARPPPTTTTRRPTPPPTQPRPTQPRSTYPPAPPMIPVGCSAAMNCTRLEMCTAMGVISKTPVILTPEQQIFRVPLTECLDPVTKEQGFCCRDPDYVDPWPVGQTGQYVPEELNQVFDSGAYNPGETRVDPVRVKPETEGYVIPQPSNTQNRLYLPPNNRI